MAYLDGSGNDAGMGIAVDLEGDRDKKRRGMRVDMSKTRSLSCFERLRSSLKPSYIAYATPT
jgi:hypothetical protein